MNEEQGVIYLDEVEDKRVVLLQSGGLDSNVLASLFKDCGFEMHHIFVDYGQNMKEKEVEYARKIVEYYGGTLSEVKLELPWLKETTSLVDNRVEDGEDGHGELNAITTGTYVPMRNQMLLSIAGSYAEAYQIPYIACAFDGEEDENGNPTGGTTDKHPTYVQAVVNSLNEGSAFKHVHGKEFTILTPVMGMYKTEIIALGTECNADFSISWSCYNKGDEPCKVCSACQLRHEAFNIMGIEDNH